MGGGVVVMDMYEVVRGQRDECCRKLQRMSGWMVDHCVELAKQNTD